MNYQDILERIVEIIKLSEAKKFELESKGEYDIDKLPENRNFEGYYPYVIYKEYKNEFDELRNMELTYYLIHSNKSSGLKNKILIDECKSLIETDPINTTSYESLIKIIQNSYGQPAYLLTYISGYFVPREELENFKKLCRKYEIGPYKKILGNKDELLETLETSSMLMNEQRRRIIKKLNQTQKIEEPVQETKNEPLKQADNSNIVHLPVDNENEQLDVSLNGNLKEIIYLGMLGHLNTHMIAELKTILQESEFKELLDTLSKYGIFSKEELMNIQLEANRTIKNINNIDELVAYFAVRKNLNASALKILIPYIGLDNFHYMMDNLYKYNAISFEQYKKYLQEYNFVDNDMVQGR